MKGICLICRKEGTIHKHHTSYEPEHIIEVCTDCHVKLHKYRMAPSLPHKHIHMVFEGSLYNELVERKREMGLTWEEYMLKSLEYYPKWSSSE